MFDLAEGGFCNGRPGYDHQVAAFGKTGQDGAEDLADHSFGMVTNNGVAHKTVHTDANMGTQTLRLRPYQHNKRVSER